MSQTVPPSNSSTEPASTDVGQVNRNGSAKSKAFLTSIYEPIALEMVQVEKILTEELSSDAPWIDELLEHSRSVGGKRMRPVFMLLCGACCGGIKSAHFHVAAAIEMIHMATLIHDDVLDHAVTRRHVPTVNSRWGNKISVLLGDYLFTHAFHVASQSESMESLRALAASSNKVCAGEMRQNAWIGNFTLSESDYLSVIADKTAELLSVSCQLGAEISGAPSELAEAYASFGRNLGIAFQIIDDVLDLVGHPSQVGKTLGTDLANRKPTLPIIHSLEASSPTKRQQLLDILQSKDVTVDNVLPFLLATDSIQYSRGVALAHGCRAEEFSAELPNSRYSEALRNVALFVLERSH